MSTSMVLHRMYSPRGKYDPDYCREMLEYFSTATNVVFRKWKEEFEQEYVITPKGQQAIKGKMKGETRAVPPDVPTFQRFANSIGVTYSTLKDWAKRYPDFGHSWERCSDLQKDFFIQGLASGRMPPAAVFIAKNLTDMRDDASLTLRAETITERPALVHRSLAELQLLRELVEKSQALGFEVELREIEGVEARTE